MDTAFCLESDLSVFDQYLYKGQEQISFVNSFVNNYTSSEAQALSPHNNNFVTNSVMSSETFHAPNFGDDEFEIQSLGQNVGGGEHPGFQGGGGGGGGGGNGGMNNPNIHYNTDYQNMSSPQNRNSPRMQMGVTSPPHQMPHSPAMTLPSPSHTISDNYNTMANQGPTYTNPDGSHSFTDSLSHMTETMPNPAVTQHSLPVNPHFPPQNLEIPPITQSNNPNMVPPHIMSHHNMGHSNMGGNGGNIFHNMTQSGLTMDPYPMQQQGHAVTQLSTINQSAISSHLGLHAGMAPHQGQMPPPQTNLVKQSPSPPQGTTRRSPNQESSEDSDDNTPLAQFAAQKRVPVITEQPKEQPITKKKPPKRKRKKDPNEPQKPVSAYALFFRDTQAAIKGQNPNASFGEVSKIVASMWDSLGVEAKQAYKQRTESAKKEYLKKLAAYRASLVSTAGEQPEVDLESPSKQKKTSVMTSIAQPPSAINAPHLMGAHRTIAPRPTGSSVPITVTMTTAATPMMHQSVMQHMQPVQRVMQGQPLMGPDGMNSAVCRRNGCNKPTIDSPDWDNEYCSNECVVDHCRYAPQMYSQHGWPQTVPQQCYRR
ncbi:uncharacterized protein [Amphiura filiformis]|uniref:uncharacterized protein isoform X3 n=1 Tax=Amphiura filiformis TaxID=82378 RepID=UPI003B21C3AF